MSSQTVSPVVPATRPGGPSRTPSNAGEPVPPLPIAQVPSVGRVPVLYAMARVDSSGRVSDQATVATLRWAAGEPLTITAESEAVIIRRDPRGVFALTSAAYVQIPAPLRARYGLRGGDRVLLAAVPCRAAPLS